MEHNYIFSIQLRNFEDKLNISFSFLFSFDFMDEK